MSSFPGTVLKQQLSAEDYEILRNISTETFAKNSNFIDLSEMHSIMIAQLGNASLREIYANETENSSHYVVFLDEGGDDLVKGRGRQVLEKYTGSKATLEVPMGVTAIDLKENSTELAGTDRE